MALVLTSPYRPTPGLDKIPTPEDLQETSELYNGLPNDHDQPPVLEQWLAELAKIFCRYRVEHIFGLHLLHSHHNIGPNQVMLGKQITDPPGYLTIPTEIQEIDRGMVHGHIFKLNRDGSMCACEYREGAAPDTSHVNASFFQELAGFIHENNLGTVLGLEVLDHSYTEMTEVAVFKDTGTIMLDASKVKRRDYYRMTGWRVVEEKGIISFAGNITHSPTSRGGHIPFKDKKATLDLGELRRVLLEEDVI